ncbi:MAG: NAD(P)-dependent dehydrogenase (short-subunit alcohol dehydrogenase family), partial [Halieaceae bacterium]
TTRVVIITGGASGIGRAFAELLASKGCLVIIADRQEDLAKEVVAGIISAGGSARAVALNVCDFDAVNTVVNDVYESEGQIDYMFNNAGIGIGGEAIDHDMDDWKQTIDVNLMGVVHGIQAVYPLMIKQGYGQIINTASIAGLVIAPAMIAYTASKHAVYSLSSALRSEAKTHGVKVNVLCPGFIDTAILTGGRYGRMKFSEQIKAQLEIRESTKPMNVQHFAEKAWGKIERNQGIIIFPARYRVLWWLFRLMPTVMTNWFRGHAVKLMSE